MVPKSWPTLFFFGLRFSIRRYASATTSHYKSFLPVRLPT